MPDKVSEQIQVDQFFGDAINEYLKYGTEKFAEQINNTIDKDYKQNKKSVYRGLKEIDLKKPIKVKKEETVTEQKNKDTKPNESKVDNKKTKKAKKEKKVKKESRVSEENNQSKKK